MVEPALRSIADTVFISDIARGAADVDVLALARSANRILITEDYDFGTLIFAEHQTPPPGVIHLVLDGMTKLQRDTKFAAEIENLLRDAPGHFVIFSRKAPRARPFP